MNTLKWFKKNYPIIHCHKCRKLIKRKEAVKHKGKRFCDEKCKEAYKEAEVYK